MQRPARPLLTVVVAVALGGCGLPSFGAPSAASEQGEQVETLYRWFAAAATGVGVFVSVLIAVTVVRFRRRTDDVPSQKAYNIPLEILYTVTPLVAVAVLFAYSVRTETSVTDLSDDPALTVQVVGFQWQWQFRYPAEDTHGELVVTGTPQGGYPELVVPVGRTTRLDLTTVDVIHDFWVPAFMVKRDMIPGVDNTIDITPTRIGTYDGVCAEFCGLDHGRMRFVLRVVDDDGYAAWRAGAESVPAGSGS